METKICTKCKEEKETIYFYKNKTRKDGFDHRCKACNTERMRKYTASGRQKEVRKIKSRKNNLNGRCRFCKNERLDTSKYCLYHFVYQIIANWKLPKEIIKTTVEELLKKLEYSEYCCHYSGLKITPGFSASIDHRIPQAKGGTHELNNLVWCHKIINSIKGDLSEKEFINRSANILVELNYLDSKGQL